jgi:hypothetical protein
MSPRTASGISEAMLQGAVVDFARLLGYRVAHFRPAMTAHGYRTPVAADGKGWPDLSLARPGRFLVVELKSDTGRLRAEQLEWLEVFRSAGVDAHVWRPVDWTSGLVERVLRDVGPSPDRLVSGCSPAGLFDAALASCGSQWCVGRWDLSLSFTDGRLRRLAVRGVVTPKVMGRRELEAL